jgi:hypothetical protein
VGALNLKPDQVQTIYDKSRGFTEAATFKLRNISACAYVGEGGFNGVYDTVFFTVFHVESEIFPDGSAIVRSLETGKVIE